MRTVQLPDTKCFCSGYIAPNLPPVLLRPGFQISGFSFVAGHRWISTRSLPFPILFRLSRMGPIFPVERTWVPPLGTRKKTLLHWNHDQSCSVPGEASPTVYAASRSRDNGFPLRVGQDRSPRNHGISSIPYSLAPNRGRAYSGGVLLFLVLSGADAGVGAVPLRHSLTE